MWLYFKQLWLLRKVRFGQNVLSMILGKSVLYQTCVSWKAQLFSRVWKEFQARVTILRTLTLGKCWFGQSLLRMSLKRAFRTVFMKTTLFFRIEENLRPVSRFWELWRSKIRFGSKLCCAWLWKDGFCIIFLAKRYSFSVLKRILGQNVSRFCRNFDCSKTVDLAKT